MRGTPDVMADTALVMAMRPYRHGRLRAQPTWAPEAIPVVVPSREAWCQTQQQAGQQARYQQAIQAARPASQPGQPDFQAAGLPGSQARQAAMQPGKASSHAARQGKHPCIHAPMQPGRQAAMQPGRASSHPGFQARYESAGTPPKWCGYCPGPRGSHGLLYIMFVSYSTLHVYIDLQYTSLIHIDYKRQHHTWGSQLSLSLPPLLCSDKHCTPPCFWCGCYVVKRYTF